MATHRQIGAPLTGRPDTTPREFGGVQPGRQDPRHAAATTATTRLWDVATRQQIGAPLTRPYNNDFVNSVAFSPDGKILATGSHDGTARLWDVATHQQIGAPLTTGNAYEVTAVAFSPDGNILATGSQDGTARLWDVATYRQIGTPLTADDSNVNAVAFSPDGNILATGGDDGTARLWDVTFPHDLVSAVCAIAGNSSLTRQEWNVDVQSEPFEQACP